MSSTENGPNRRTVLKGAAWSAPLIVVATAAPSYAASGTVTTVIVANRPGANTTVNVSVLFTKTANGSTGTLTVDVTLTALAATGTLNNGPTAVNGGTLVGLQGTGTDQSRTYRFTVPNINGSAGATATLTFSFTTSASTTTGTASATSTAPTVTVANSNTDPYGIAGV